MLHDSITVLICNTYSYTDIFKYCPLGVTLGMMVSSILSPAIVSQDYMQMPTLVILSASLTILCSNGVDCFDFSCLIMCNL